MKNVYTVNSGSYSDYCINAIFSTLEKAQEFMALVPDMSYNDIEEYELDPPHADKIKSGHSIWRVLMLKTGDVEEVGRVGTGTHNVSRAGAHSVWRRTAAPAYREKGIPDVLISTVWAKTEKQAVKIVNEHRAAMIASGEWE